MNLIANIVSILLRSIKRLQIIQHTPLSHTSKQRQLLRVVQTNLFPNNLQPFPLRNFRSETKLPPTHLRNLRIICHACGCSYGGCWVCVWVLLCVLFLFCCVLLLWFHCWGALVGCCLLLFSVLIVLSMCLFFADKRDNLRFSQVCLPCPFPYWIGCVMCVTV